MKKTVTNDEGIAELICDPASTLTISAFGYESVEIDVNSRTDIIVELPPPSTGHDK